MPYFLAIDAGGTSTRALLADSEHILARATTGSVKLMRVGEPEATTRLHALLDQLASTAGVSLADLTRVCFGLAGVTIPSVHSWATSAIAARTAAPLLLLGDEEIALDAAFGCHPESSSPEAAAHPNAGILIIAGTGSNCIGRDPCGQIHRAGGHGPILGDEGAGYWIGLEAARRALHARDTEDHPAALDSATTPDFNPTPTPGAPFATAPASRAGSALAPTPPVLSFRSEAEESASPAATPATRLLAAILAAWNLNALSDLIDLGNHRGDASRPAPDFASLVPAVAGCAAQGNPIAAGILAEAGAHLADLVTIVANKIQPQPPAHNPTALNLEPRTLDLEVAFTGSVLTHVTPVRDSMIVRLAQTLPAARVQPHPTDPLDGALLRARHG